jgi:hypothetical protein
MVFSSNGTRLLLVARGDLSPKAQLFDAATGRTIPLIQADHDSTGLALFSPDGKILMTAGQAIHLWDAITGKELREPLEHGIPVTAAAFSPNGRMLVTASSNSWSFWDFTRPELIHRTSAPDQPVERSEERSEFIVGSNRFGDMEFIVARIWPKALILTRDSQHMFEIKTLLDLAGVHRPNVALLWDTTTQKMIASFAAVEAAAFSPDGRILATSTESTTRLWDATTGKAIHSSFPGVLLDSFGNTIGGFCAAGKAIFLRNPDSGDTLGHTALETMFFDVTSGKRLGALLVDRWPLAAFPEIVAPSNAVHATGFDTFFFGRGPSSWDERPEQLFKVGPLRGDYELITLWTQVLTRSELDADDIVQKLDEPTWDQRRRRLEQMLPTSESADLMASVVKDRLCWVRCEAEESEKAEKWAEAIGYLDRLIAAEPTWQHHDRRGRAYANLGEFAKAAADYARAKDLGREKWENEGERWYEYGLLLLATSQVEAYRRLCDSADDGNDHTWWRRDDYTWWLLLLGNEPPKERGSWVADFPFQLGFLSYRAGRFDDAVKELIAETNFRAKTSDWSDRMGLGYLLLAMSHHRLGHSAEAREWLDKAVKWIEQAERTKKTPDDKPVTWTQKLELQLLRKEAESLIEGKPSESNK